ncbi:SRPBCC family protein [Rhodococcus coprophilus]|uniref:aromatic ring-hydroxylating oxygenase subunit alpha n=1 Tax=Rhodococcus coprophilus TaxID=38310 RepID=UPI00093349DD|nr:aromatic ring-hydroxylating dioxygenase subunit alpha [Rhodococcus coprophilus]
MVSVESVSTGQPVEAGESVRPGQWVDSGPGLSDLDFTPLTLQITTDRYTSREYAERERVSIWERVWQVVGRADELPDAGDRKEFHIFDQSYFIVRGRDGVIRGFVNACRHRGNILCRGTGGGARINCPYHLWSYDLQGNLVGVGRSDLDAEIDKAEHSLLQVSVECFAGFVFINPDPNAAPLVEFFGDEVAELLAPYHLDEMTTVLNVRESLECNWKVVIDAFSEGYHIAGIHPELLRVINIDPTTVRYRFFEDHSVSVAPFEVKNVENFGPEDELEGIRELPGTFPGIAAYLPRLEELADSYRNTDGVLEYPEGVSGRSLLQQATRETLTGMGFDVSGLTDAQMSDNHGWVLFPNFFMTVRAGEATVIVATPHPDGDPARCVWQIISVMYLPAEYREAARAQQIEVEEPGSFKYFLALQQDYEQMPRQQIGLRNKSLEYMSLIREEVPIAKFHSVLDRYLAGKG